MTKVNTERCWIAAQALWEVQHPIEDIEHGWRNLHLAEKAVAWHDAEAVLLALAAADNDGTTGILRAFLERVRHNEVRVQPNEALAPLREILARSRAGSGSNSKQEASE